VKERTFLLHVLPFEGDKFKIRAKSDTGGAEELTARPVKLDQGIRGVKESIFRCTNTVSRGSDIGVGATYGADSRVIMELGSDLFSFLFPGEIETLYRQAIEKASEKNESLRLKLRVDDSATDLSDIPWEALFDTKTRGFLSTGQRPVFTRAVNLDDRKIRTPARLEILGIISAPKEFDGIALGVLDVDKERADITEELKSLEAQGKARLSWSPSGTLRDLRRRLFNPENQVDGWTVLHFIGHGGFDAEKGIGFVLLEAPDGSSNASKLYADTLAQMLARRNGPQLVILNSCSGAQADSRDIFSSTAGMLALAGIPAVVAMQYPVTDKMAIEFAKRFYGMLTEGEGLDIQNAVAQTRNELKGEGFGEWISPVLYLSSRDGRLIRN